MPQMNRQNDVFCIQGSFKLAYFVVIGICLAEIAIYICIISITKVSCPASTVDQAKDK